MNVSFMFDNRLGVKEDVLIGQEEKAGLDAVVIDGIAVDSFDDALKRVQEGSVITINKNSIMNNDYQVYRHNFTIELNKATLVCNQSFYMFNKSLTITGEGTIRTADIDNNTPFIMCNTYDDWAVEINIDGKITVMGDACIFTNNNSKNATMNIGKDVVFDSYWYGIATNGTSTNSVVNFNGTSITRAPADGEPLGFYFAGDGIYTFNGNSKVVSTTGIEIRAGELIINGGEYISDGDGDPIMHANGSGSTGVNICISVAEHTTKLPIAVTINGGVFKAKGAAFMEGDPNNTGVATENTTIAIYGGIFSGKEAIKTLNPESDCKNFIYGGKFSNLENEDYIAKGYKAEKAYNGTTEVIKE